MTHLMLVTIGDEETLELDIDQLAFHRDLLEDLINEPVLMPLSLKSIAEMRKLIETLDEVLAACEKEKSD